MTSGGNVRKRVSRSSKKLQQYQEARHAELIAREQTQREVERSNQTVQKEQGGRRGGPNPSIERRKTRRYVSLTAGKALSPTEAVRSTRDLPNADRSRQRGNVLDEVAAVAETPPQASKAMERKRIRGDSNYSQGPTDGRASIAEKSDSEEDSRPSKKRMSCVTPPDGQLQAPYDDSDDENALDERDSPVEDDADVEEGETNENGSVLGTIPSLSPTGSAAYRAGATEQLNDVDGRNGFDSQLKADSPVLLGMFVNLRGQIIEAIRNESKSQISQLHIIKNDMSEMREVLRDLNTVVHVKGSIAGSAGLKSSSSRTPLDQWEKKLDESLVHFGLVFTTEVFSRVIGYNLTSSIANICNEQRSLRLVDKASEAVSMLLFSLQPYQNRDLFGTGVALLHCDFKYSVVKNAFYNVQVNSFGHFREENARDSAHSDNNSSQSHPADQKICQPAWLRRDYVRGDNVLSARSFLEKKNQKKSTSVRETPCRSDIAMHGAIRVYRALGAHLHNGREKVKSSFFQDIGYLPRELVRIRARYRRVQVEARMVL